MTFFHLYFDVNALSIIFFSFNCPLLTSVKDYCIKRGTHLFPSTLYVLILWAAMKLTGLLIGFLLIGLSSALTEDNYETIRDAFITKVKSDRTLQPTIVRLSMIFRLINWRDDRIIHGQRMLNGAFFQLFWANWAD